MSGRARGFQGGERVAYFVGSASYRNRVTTRWRTFLGEEGHRGGGWLEKKPEEHKNSRKLTDIKGKEKRETGEKNSGGSKTGEEDITSDGIKQGGMA